MNKEVYLDTAFLKKVNADFKTCGFDKNLQYGILFFMGVNCNLDWQYTYPECKSFIYDNEGEDDFFTDLCSLCATNTFENELDVDSCIDTNLIEKIIESYHYVLKYKFNGNLLTGVYGKNNDKWLRHLDEEVFPEYREHFANIVANEHSKYYLTAYLLSHIGSVLRAYGFTKKQALYAGCSFFEKGSNIDALCYNMVLTETIQEFSPLFRAFMKYPISCALDPALFENTHLFTNVLESFLGYEQSAGNALIMAYHQGMFSKAKNQNKSIWSDCEREHDLINMVFDFGFSLRESPMRLAKNFFEETSAVSLQDILDKYVDNLELFEAIFTLMSKKYGYGMEVEFHDHAELIQFLPMFFYETTIHAIISLSYLKEEEIAA